eukprot:Skav222009  [mRNA]  locus=scaffold2020:277253:278120:- [translate_table: standard]
MKAAGPGQLGAPRFGRGVPATAPGVGVIERIGSDIFSGNRPRHDDRPRGVRPVVRPVGQGRWPRCAK